MSAGPHFFVDSARVEAVPVVFAGVECRAIEVMNGPAIGLYIRIGEPSPTHWRVISDATFAPVMRPVGQLDCEGCRRPIRFPCSGQVLTFPWAPMPGWSVHTPSALGRQSVPPQTITVHVRCDRCSAQAVRYAEQIFDYGHPL